MRAACSVLARVNIGKRSSAAMAEIKPRQMTELYRRSKDVRRRAYVL